jgi:hypothetical protein
MVRRMSTWKTPLPVTKSSTTGGAGAPNPMLNRRRDVEKAYARVFEKVIFRDPVVAASSPEDKTDGKGGKPDGKGETKAKSMSASERKRTEERRRDILEVFLKSW